RIDKLPNNNGWQVSLQVALSPDLKAIAVPLGSEIALYNMTTGQERKKIKYNTDHRTTLLYSRDGKSLYAVTGKAEALATWDSETGNLIRQIGTPPETGTTGGGVRMLSTTALS